MLNLPYIGSVGPLEARGSARTERGTSGHGGRCPLYTERLSGQRKGLLWPLALWARPVAVHASSMVESTADDHLTLELDGDAMFVVGADPEHAGMYPLERRRSSDCSRIVDGRALSTTH